MVRLLPGQGLEVLPGQAHQPCPQHRHDCPYRDDVDPGNQLFSDELHRAPSGPTGTSGSPAYPHCGELKDLAILRIRHALFRRGGINVSLFAILESVNIQATLKDSADLGFVYPDLKFGLDPVFDLGKR